MISNLLSRLSGLLGSVLGWLSRRASPKSSNSIPSTSLNLARVIRMLEFEEGRRNEPYKDSLGYWTIGIGHLIDERKGGSLPSWAQDELDRTGRLSDASVDKLLEDDIIFVMDQLEKYLPWASSLDQIRYTVLLDMTFQMGIGNEEKGTGLLGFKNTLRYIKDGNYEQAATNMGVSLWYRQTPNRANRRIKEMRTGEFHQYH